MIRNLVVLLSFAVLVACAQSPRGLSEFVSSSDVSPTAGSEKQTLELSFIGSGEGSSSSGLPKVIASQPETAAIRNKCGEPEFEAEGLPAFLLPFAGLIIDHALKMIEKDIEAELALYLKSYSRTMTTMVYSDVSGSRPVAKWQCFRLTRLAERFDEETGKGDRHNHLPDEPIALDLVGQIQVDEVHGDVLRVRPLRLYVSATQAKATQVDAKRPLGVSIGLAARSTWLQDNAGMSADVFDVKLASAKFNLDSPSPADRVVYFVGAKTDGDGWIDVPFPAWSTNATDEANATDEGGRTAFTVNVAEAGRPPRYLETFKELFSATSGQIGSLLKDAIKKAFE